MTRLISRSLRLMPELSLASAVSSSIQSYKIGSGCLSNQTSEAFSIDHKVRQLIQRVFPERTSAADLRESHRLTGFHGCPSRTHSIKLSFKSSPRRLSVECRGI
ncbi:hypothetical protein AVEN_245598-1 [Araneus ventricosus]|uniref:Uncharacterized protein n=1 Tax=Araneus ventricosus TaxID=182803 RepID=A0A4Y2IVE8_ARAVE|nr:hypothetical protein AVEN_245598-1 [Araneus ventricosus]